MHKKSVLMRKKKLKTSWIINFTQVTILQFFVLQLWEVICHMMVLAFAVTMVSQPEVGKLNKDSSFSGKQCSLFAEYNVG